MQDGLNQSAVSICTSEFLSFEQVNEILPLRQAKMNVIQLLVRVGNQLQLRDFKLTHLDRFDEMAPLTRYQRKSEIPFHVEAMILREI